MKSAPPSTARQIVWLSKLDLSVHDAVSVTPEDTALIDLLAEEFASGEDIRDPLEVTAENEVLDGRHRLKGALRTDRMTLLPCVLTDADPEAVVLAKLSQRRHYSKSARAYALRHHAANVARNSREAAARGLIPGNKAGSRHPTQLGHEKKGSQTLGELAAKSGLSEELLRQAIKLERDYMSRADQLVSDWLAQNEDEARAWYAWLDDRVQPVTPWTVWRKIRLTEMGEKDDPKSVNIIPRNHREQEEEKIFNGVHDPDGDDSDRKSYSLGASLKALGSIFATEGKRRPDLDAEQPALCITLQNKIKTFTKTMWAQWDTLGMPDRVAVCKSLTEQLGEWPEEARRAVFAKLKEEWK